MKRSAHLTEDEAKVDMEEVPLWGYLQVVQVPIPDAQDLGQPRDRTH